MKNIDDIKLDSHSKVREALKVIDRGALQIALVVDENNYLLGTITDGDIRRGILNGLDLDSSIKNIINPNPTFVRFSDNKEYILKVGIEKRLNQIPVLDENDKLIGLHIISDLLKVAKKVNRVILMVGGLGTRLRPLTENMPKPMLKVGNKPILQTIIERFSEYGYDNITLCVNYKSDIIKEYFGDGSGFGVNIDYVFETKRMGTAGALSLLEYKPSEPFFVMNGDLLTNINFEHLYQYHISNNAVATMCVREYKSQIPYGVVNITDDSRITSIEEKPTHKSFVSAGIYMLSPELLDCIPSNQYYDMPALFESLIQNNKNVFSFPLRDYWIDIGRIEEYKKANEEYSEFF